MSVITDVLVTTSFTSNPPAIAKIYRNLENTRRLSGCIFILEVWKFKKTYTPAIISDIVPFYGHPPTKRTPEQRMSFTLTSDSAIGVLGLLLEQCTHTYRSILLGKKVILKPYYNHNNRTERQKGILFFRSNCYCKDPLTATEF